MYRYFTPNPNLDTEQKANKSSVYIYLQLPAQFQVRNFRFKKGQAPAPT